MLDNRGASGIIKPVGGNPDAKPLQGSCPALKGLFFSDLMVLVPFRVRRGTLVQPAASTIRLSRLAFRGWIAKMHFRLDRVRAFRLRPLGPHKAK